MARRLARMSPPVGGQMNPGVPSGDRCLPEWSAERSVRAVFSGSSAGFSFADLVFQWRSGRIYLFRFQPFFPNRTTVITPIVPLGLPGGTLSGGGVGGTQEQRHCGRRQRRRRHGRNIERGAVGGARSGVIVAGGTPTAGGTGGTLSGRSGRSQEQRHCGRRHADGWWNRRNIVPRGGQQIVLFCYCHGWGFAISGRRAITNKRWRLYWRVWPEGRSLVGTKATTMHLQKSISQSHPPAGSSGFVLRLSKTRRKTGRACRWPAPGPPLFPPKKRASMKSPPSSTRAGISISTSAPSRPSAGCRGK